ncbi:hypothetical protein BUALT_Bualt03G0156900 [Buddleja alternifolia]|uniref:Ubiquitin carboxyl-terminal hydrolase n=1 Tax=Buddleja alternifolia TaxID=168488 RepID=A0AAV6XV08_9LAMI|nr:hypothetical protein BUALT_Bualt03G0156900 [Buddleja alternifolia]
MRMLQMTWQPSLVKLLKRKHGAPPLGLKNLGNSCYLNSVLQCLTYTPPLANFCLGFLHSSIWSFSPGNFGAGKEKGDCPFCILEKRIARSLCSDAVADSPLKVHSCLRIYADHFRSGRQEDAHEFLRYVIDSCHNTCMRLKKLQRQQRWKTGVANGGDVSGTEETVVKEIFGGALQSQVRCLSCGAESNKVDEIMDMSLDILHSGSLREALQKFFQPELLDGNNKYKCDNCKELVVARKQMSILQAPNVLVIQLKRFEGMFGGKVDKPIAFDEILELSNHMCKASQDQHPEYNLFGTVVHSGFSPDSGHYYAYVKDAFARWYCCNDSYVSVSTLQEVLSEKAYILFFSRTKQRPRTRVDAVVNGSKSHELNGSKMSIIRMSGCLEKPFSSTQISYNQTEVNNSTKSVESNGTRLVTQKSGCSEKPLNTKLSANHSENGNSTDYRTSIGTKTSISQRSDHVEIPMEHSETSNSTKLKVNGGLSSQRSKFGDSGSTNKVIRPDNIKTAVIKRESREENGCKTALVTGLEKEKTNCPVNESNGMSKRSAPVLIPKRGPSLLGINNGQNGHIAFVSLRKSSTEVNGSKLATTSRKCLDPENLLNEDITCSSNKSGMKKKIGEDHSCIFLARDDQSRAEVEAFKELIGKEASIILRSCGWSNEVHDFMRARKKVCQEAGNCASNDHERKTLLISHAKRNFIAKVPESLKTSLIERLRLFSEEKQ